MKSLKAIMGCNDLINKVLSILEERGITLYRLMMDTGISKRTVYSLRGGNPTIQTLMIICDYLDLEVSFNVKNEGEKVLP